VIFLIAEIIPEFYDVEGKKVFRPDSRRRSGFKPTFPAGRFLSQPLKYWCTDFADMRRFLSKCKYVSDEEQFGKKDYWEPPDQFEETRQGDCEDFALWAWRQLLHMGYPSRFVMGRSGRYGEVHGWVTFQKDGHSYVLEALASPAGLTLPRLSIIRYKPKFSMSWDGENVSYFEHQDRKVDLPLQLIPPLVAEWLLIWAKFWLSLPVKFGRAFFRKRSGRKQSQTAGTE
jgi:hypothetical protein